jgi:hypothetical protein
MSLIFKKIFLDLDINYTYNNIINLLYKYLWKYNIEYIYIYIYTNLIIIKDISLKLSFKNEKIIKNYNKILNIQEKQFICFFKTYTGMDLWHKFYKKFYIEWIWMYDIWLLFYVLRLYILDFYFLLFIIIIK